MIIVLFLFKAILILNVKCGSAIDLWHCFSYQRVEERSLCISTSAAQVSLLENTCSLPRIKYLSTFHNVFAGQMCYIELPAHLCQPASLLTQDLCLINKTARQIYPAGAVGGLIAIESGLFSLKANLGPCLLPVQ